MIEKFLDALAVRPKLQGPRAVFNLRRGTVRTAVNPVISELVLIATQDEDLEWAYDTQPFLAGEDFESFVGMTLPMGIGKHRPAIIVAVQRFANPDWEILACYADLTYPRLLWREQEPKWFKGDSHG